MAKIDAVVGATDFDLSGKETFLNGINDQMESKIGTNGSIKCLMTTSCKEVLCLESADDHAI